MSRREAAMWQDTKDTSYEMLVSEWMWVGGCFCQYVCWLTGIDILTDDYLSATDYYNLLLSTAAVVSVGVLLNQAFIQYGIAFLRKRQYSVVQPPFMMRKEVSGPIGWGLSDQYGYTAFIAADIHVWSYIYF